MSTVQELYPAGTTLIDAATWTVATSSTLTTGRQTDAVSNIGNLDLDHLVTGDADLSGTATTSTQIQYWVIPCQTDDLAGTVTWPDVFTGVSGTVTVSSIGVLQGCGRLGAVSNVDFGTGTNVWFVQFSVSELFGGVMPTHYQLFVTQNTGKGLTFAGGLFYTRLQATVA